MTVLDGGRKEKCVRTRDVLDELVLPFEVLAELERVLVALVPGSQTRCEKMTASCMNARASSTLLLPLAFAPYRAAAVSNGWSYPATVRA